MEHVDEHAAKLETVAGNEMPVRPASSCPTCAGGAKRGAEPAPAPPPPSFVYALGRVDARFPSASIEKEYLQATARTENAGKTDRQTLHAVLSARENRYLARHVCWVLAIEGLDSYILAPRDASDLELLIDGLRPTSRPADVNAVIGLKGPLAPPSMCNGLQIPIVLVDQVYSFDVDALVASIPRPTAMTEEKFRPAAEELFLRISQLTDNAGATDEHRALNYLAVRYPAIYAAAAEAFARNASLASVDVHPSRLSGGRRIMDVVFTFVDRVSGVGDKLFTRVDVTDAFPFLLSKLQPYFDR